MQTNLYTNIKMQVFLEFGLEQENSKSLDLPCDRTSLKSRNGLQVQRILHSCSSTSTALCVLAALVVIIFTTGLSKFHQNSSRPHGGKNVNGQPTLVLLLVQHR